MEFVLTWDETGAPSSVFRPAFWLPDHGRFLEVEVEKQKVIAQKSTALATMRLLYPDVDVKVVSPRSYRGLVKRRVLGVASPAAAMLCG